MVELIVKEICYNILTDVRRENIPPLNVLVTKVIYVKVKTGQVLLINVWSTRQSVY